MATDVARHPTTTTTTSTTTTEPAPTTTTEPPLPAFPPYEPLHGEVETQAKTVAARIAEALTTYDPGAGQGASVAAALAHAVPGIDDGHLASVVAPLFVDGTTSRGRVVYPQLGGLDPHDGPNRCSVMVVVEQHLSDGRGETVISRCLDVRLRLVDGDWQMEDLPDISDAPVERPPDLVGVAAQVLDHPAIWLPDNVRWDIYDGFMDEGLLAELVLLADRVPIAATTCRRGHPVNVFGTDRQSAHMDGRAIDLWSVGGPVVQQSVDQGSAAYEAGRGLHRAGRVKNFGSPWRFDGPGGSSFTDPVHLDHFHLGF